MSEKIYSLQEAYHLPNGISRRRACLLNDLSNTITISLPYPKNFLIIYESHGDVYDHWVIGRFNSYSNVLRLMNSGNDYAFQIIDFQTKQIVDIPIVNIKSMFPFTDSVGQFLDHCKNPHRDLGMTKSLLFNICKEINEQGLDIMDQLKQYTLQGNENG